MNVQCYTFRMTTEGRAATKNGIDYTLWHQHGAGSNQVAPKEPLPQAISKNTQWADSQI